MYVKTLLISLAFNFINEKPVTYVANLDEVVVTAKSIKKEDVIFLAKIVHSEGSISKEDYLAIAHTVVVRMAYKQKTMKEVCIKKQYNGFDTAKFHTNPPKEAIWAATQALLGNSYHIYPPNLYYFHNYKTSTNRKWVNHIRKYKWKDIGDHEFCLNHKM